MGDLNALAWVDGVGVNNGFLSPGASRPFLEITAALTENEVYVSEMVSAQISLEQYFLEGYRGVA